MNWIGPSNEKEEKIQPMVNLVLKRLQSGKYVTQVRPHFLSALLTSDEGEADCTSIADVLYSRLVESISKTSRSQTIVLNGKTTTRRVKTTLKLLDRLFGVGEKTSIASEQLSLFYRLAATNCESNELLKPLFAFNVGITFKTEKESSKHTPLDFDVSASIFNRFEIEYLIEKKSPYQTSVQSIVEKFEIFKDLLCAPTKMLEPLLGQTFVGLKYFSFINNLKKDVNNSESRFYDFLKNLKRALLCSTREINTLLRTLSIILLLVDLEDNTSSDAFNSAIKIEIEGHLETFDSEMLGHVCDILHLEQFEVLKSIGLMINNEREELSFAFMKCSSFACILFDSLFRWMEQKCGKASKSFVNSVSIDEDLDSDNIAAIHLIGFPEIVADKEGVHSFGDLWCNASSEHAYSWALQYLVEDISTTHTKEGFLVTEPLMDILDGSPSREIIDFLFGSTGLLCSHPSLSEIQSSYHDRKDAIDKVIHFFRNNSYYGLGSVNNDSTDGNIYLIDHSFGRFKYEVGSFFPKYINEDVQHQIMKSGIPSVEISDLHKDFLHSMKKMFSPTALNSDPTFVTFFSVKPECSTNDLAQQMILSQIMAVSEVSEKSFDVTISKKSFWKAFNSLSYKKFDKDLSIDKAVSRILLQYAGAQKIGPAQMYYIGKSSVMMKRSLYDTLRAHVYEIINEASAIIQRQWRHYRLKQKLVEALKELLNNKHKRIEVNSASLPNSGDQPSTILNQKTKPRLGVSTTTLSEKKKKLQKSYVYGLVKRKEAIKKAMSPIKKSRTAQRSEKFDLTQQISIVQALIRRRLVSSEHTKKVDMCLKIQSMYREKKSKEIEREIRKRKIEVIKKRNEQKKHEMEKYNRAATKIQNAWVNFKENYLQKQLVEAVLIIQRAWRAYKLKSSLKILLKIRREGERKKREFEEREQRLKEKEIQVMHEAKELEYKKQMLVDKERLFSRQQLADKKFKEKEEQVWNSLREISSSLIQSGGNHETSSPPHPPMNSRMPQLSIPSQKQIVKVQKGNHEYQNNLRVYDNEPSTQEKSNSKKLSYSELLKEKYGSAFEQKQTKSSSKKVNKTESEIDKSKILSPRKVSNNQNKSTILTYIPKRLVTPKQPTNTDHRPNLNISKYQPNTVIVPEHSLKHLIEKNEKKSKKTNETWNQWNLLIQELSDEVTNK